MNSPLPNPVGSILLAFGANLPWNGQPPRATLQAALQALTQGEGIEIQQLSSLWQTPAFPAGSGPDFVNAAARAFAPANLDVASLLAALHRVEAQFGRERHRRWGGRTLDIDLIAAGDSVLPDPATQDRWRALPPEDQARLVPDGPILPHPRLQDRAFVLVPLAEVAPGWRHPRLGLTVAQMCDALPAAERAAMHRL